MQQKQLTDKELLNAILSINGKIESKYEKLISANKLLYEKYLCDDSKDKLLNAAKKEIRDWRNELTGMNENEVWGEELRLSELFTSSGGRQWLNGFALGILAHSRFIQKLAMYLPFDGLIKGEESARIEFPEFSTEDFQDYFEEEISNLSNELVESA